MPQGRFPASAYYAAPVAGFAAAQPYEVLGALAAAHTHDVEVDQRLAWEEEIEILRSALTGLEGTLYLEFDVPRLGSRIDAVLVSGQAVFPIEFKCGERHFRVADYNQAWDYGLDLKNFHAASHDVPILPILVATQSDGTDDSWRPASPDGVRPPFRCGARHLRTVLENGLALSSGRAIDGEAWGSAPYHPTPTIIEAARALYAYRVLLTRARQGMVVFVPPGDESDPTRAPTFYNETYEYLTGIGVTEV